jgi:hypothetical protein
VSRNREPLLLVADNEPVTFYVILRDQAGEIVREIDLWTIKPGKAMYLAVECREMDKAR